MGLSPGTISRIVRRLFDPGVASEHAACAAGPGRKSDISRFNSRSAGVIAVDLGGTKCHGVLADLAAEMLAEDYRPTHEHGDPARTLLGCIAKLRSEATSRDLEVRAVVVGIPAVQHPDSGLVSGSNVHWEGYDLIGLLREHVAEPFRIENDVTLAAIGQAWRGEGQALSGFVTLSLGTGIGGAIFANGQLVRGRHNAAAEIGHLLTNRAQLRAGDGTPALESVASGPAIAARARELLAGGAKSQLAAGDFTAADVFRAADDGDALAERVIDEVIDYVAMAVVDIAAMLDPERIILDGSIGRALERYVDRITERVARCVPHVPELRFSRLGPNATVIGAIAGGLALERDTDARRAIGELPSDRIQTLPSIPPYGAVGGDGDRRPVGRRCSGTH